MRAGISCLGGGVVVDDGVLAESLEFPVHGSVSQQEERSGSTILRTLSGRGTFPACIARRSIGLEFVPHSGSPCRFHAAMHDTPRT